MAAPELLRARSLDVDVRHLLQRAEAELGIGGFAGAFSALLFQRLTGHILEVTDSNYALLFPLFGFAYLAAWAIIHLLVPRMSPVRLSEEAL